MEQLPHASSSGASGSMPYHTITTTALPSQRSTSTSAKQVLNAFASSSKLAPPPPCAPPQKQTKPRLPPRPTFGRRQYYDPINSTFTRLASGIARVQAQPHKPKRPSPLHTSHSPEFETISDDHISSNTSSPSESSPELCHVEHAEQAQGLGTIAEEKKGNMLGLELDGNGWNWYGEVQERMKEPRTPFPSPAIYV